MNWKSINELSLDNTSNIFVGKIFVGKIGEGEHFSYDIISYDAELKEWFFPMSVNLDSVSVDVFEVVDIALIEETEWKILDVDTFSPEEGQIVLIHNKSGEHYSYRLAYLDGEGDLVDLTGDSYIEIPSGENRWVYIERNPSY